MTSHVRRSACRSGWGLANVANTNRMEVAGDGRLGCADAGLIQSLDRHRIETLARQPDRLPLVRFMSISEAKTILKKLRLFNDEINEIGDREFQEALRKFQSQRGHVYADGVLGPITATDLRKAAESLK